MSNHVTSVVVAIDGDGNEALYVDGFLKSAQGEPTVYACDIAGQVASDQQITFRHVRVDRPDYSKWPDDLDSALKWLDEE